MFKNYLKTNFRIVLRHKVNFIINVSGLAVGLACCILILLWIGNEIQYDRFHEKSNDLYRVVNDLNFMNISKLTDRTAYPLGPAMKEEIPEVREYARFLSGGKVLVANNDKRFYEENLYFTDSSFLKMFTFTFIYGDPLTALSSPSSIVITNEMALKYFGNENPIGKTILVQNQHEYIISAVIENIPGNSHLKFAFLATMSRALSLGAKMHWSGWLYSTYILLQPNSDYNKVNKILETWIKTKDSKSTRYYLQPLKEIHLYGLKGEGAIRSLSFFSILAVLILLIACINYINLATVQSGCRAKEIGLRKVIGASKNIIMRQFFFESFIYVLCALLISIILVQLTLPFFNQLSGENINFSFIQNKFIFLGIICITFITGLCAGLYPSLYISSFQPVKILKNNFNIKSIKRKSFSMRRSLIVFQFILSIGLMICTFTVNKQVEYFREKELGFEKEHLIYAQLMGGGNLWEKDDFQKIWNKYKVLKSYLQQNPDIKNVTASSNLLFDGLPKEMGQLDWDGKNPELKYSMNHMAVDQDFTNTFKLELVDGRFFSTEIISDSCNFVLNETAIKMTGLKSPIGERFRLGNKTGRIIGVIKDFHFASFYEQIQPLIIHMMPYKYWMYRNYLVARVNSADITGTIESMKKTWQKVFPDYPVELNFLDNKIDNLYKSEQKLGVILRFFTSIAIFISCLGLFGLISFSTEKRTKEIGIRKVLGAKASGIALLLTKEFTALVLIANIIAWPLSYYIMNKWIQDFAYKTEIGIWIYILSASIALFITLFTIGVHVIRSSTANPVDSLRYE